MFQDSLIFNSIEHLPGYSARAAFLTTSSAVFREDGDGIVPISLPDSNVEYIPWGADNMMPFNLLDLIEKDETLSTCQLFNSEVCYGAGLKYCCKDAAPKISDEIEDFMLDNDFASYFLGTCIDLKHFAFAVSVIILNEDRTKIVSLIRKEACYCRFSPMKSGKIPYVIYANWRKCGVEKPEIIDLLDPASPWRDLRSRVEQKNSPRKFAIVTRIPAADSTYYPIPYYGALFRGKWYDIKTLIGIAKEAKLRNSAPIKYHIEISKSYWDRLLAREKITDVRKAQERIVTEKKNIIDFLTGAENSGKAYFSTFYVDPNGQTQKDVVINRIETGKEGGDWETDIQEAINMICFTMRVHSNLVGSVPGKAQSNNSGSDKRELYTIAQALQKPYHDLLFTVHRIIIRFNGWKGVRPEVPFIQLTTLDEHKDAKTVTLDSADA